MSGLGEQELRKWPARQTALDTRRRNAWERRAHIDYSASRTLTAEELTDLLRRSTLAERRPVDDASTIRAMLDDANLLCTAWHGEKLVGVARSLTDFAYCCYLSDLAVDTACQRQGIGKRLIELTQLRLGRHAQIILLAAPQAANYYAHIGFTTHDSAWILPAGKSAAGS